MSLICLDSIDDPRVAPYRNLKDRELAREGNLFIAEGEHVVRRLIASSFEVHSVLVAQRRAEEIAPLVPPDVPVYVVPDEVVHRIIGFKFHSGVIACGRRRPSPTLDDAVPPTGRAVLIICPEIANTENLGLIVRVAAGFGVSAVVLGERSCDPYFRQAIRVSMGAVFFIPIVRSENLMRDLDVLREKHVELIATVLESDAEPLQDVPRLARVGLLLGNEAQGLDRRWIDACSRGVTIPMQHRTDSLNVAIAAGVFLYHFTR